jgi:hypothetical protein
MTPFLHSSVGCQQNFEPSLDAGRWTQQLVRTHASIWHIIFVHYQCIDIKSNGSLGSEAVALGYIVPAKQ